MKQYLQLLEDIKEWGTYKTPAREGMPGTTSLFGYQFRHNLNEGFPLLTTKEIKFKHIVIELLWFLKGDTNIKYLVDNDCNIWNEDAYNYYLKKCKEQNLERTISFDLFVSYIKNSKNFEELKVDSLKNSQQNNLIALIPKNYTLGDCGKQYGWLWRNWNSPETNMFYIKSTVPHENVVKLMEEWRKKQPNKLVIFSTKDNIDSDIEPVYNQVDQFKELIEGLKKNPMSRRHIITAWNPSTLNDMALNACHAFVQFNCRPLNIAQKALYVLKHNKRGLNDFDIIENNITCNYSFYDEELKIPEYYLDCQMYQRSADVFLGVPYNIASYALLTEILAKICNMVPGEFIHTFGDVHIYDNHKEQVDIQLEREPEELPQLKFSINFQSCLVNLQNDHYSLDDFINELDSQDFIIENYNPQSSIKAELSTGMKK